jgi:hypothetical protein
MPLKLQSLRPYIGYDNIFNMLEVNLKMYYDLALLRIGGWTDVTIPTVGGYGGDYSVLTMVQDPNYIDGQVWQAPRKDFVWEQTIDYVNTNGDIVNPSGVGTPQINGADATLAYHVNYPQGQIIFDMAIPANSSVALSYAYRYIQIYRADNATWWKEMQFKSHRVDSDQLSSYELDWSILSEHRVQLPAIVIESIPNGTSASWELGSTSKIASRDIAFHIYTESTSDCRQLMDILSLQNERTIPLFDTVTIAENDAFPLDYRGELLANNHYFNLVSLYPWKKCRMKDATITDVQTYPNLCNAVVRTTIEIIV